MRIYLGAFGDAGHAFPMLALGEALVARGHSVALQTWRNWEEHATAGGMAFAAAPEYQVFPTREQPLAPYAAAVRAARETVPSVREFGPDVVVADILTVAPALAAELCDVPAATLVPHVFPWTAPGFPPYSLGARLPRTRAGARAWRAFDPLVARGLERGRDEYNASRARLGLPPLDRLHTALSRELTLVATLPQLEYPRDWPAWTRITGPLLWEPPGERVDPPPGDGPVVLIAPSTAQDPGHRMLRAALAGLAGAPVRVIATYNGRVPDPPVRVPAQRRPRPLALLRPHDARLRPRGHARRPRHARARARVRLPGRRLPGGRRHARERRARRLGRARRAAARPAPLPAHAAARRRAGAGRPGLAARARATAAWLDRHDGAVAAARALEAWTGRFAGAHPG